MWNRKEDEVKPVEAPAKPVPVSEPPRAVVQTTGGQKMDTVVKIGKSIYIRGELSGNEDLTIEGTVHGKVELKDHNLIVGSTGKIQAEVHAKAVTIQGEVQGNVHAEDRIELSTSGTVKGDLVAPRIVIADGARFKGTVDMEKPAVKPQMGAPRPGMPGASPAQPSAPNPSPAQAQADRPAVVGVSSSDPRPVKA